MRTASHAFQNWLELDREILGGDYRGHYGSGLITKVAIANGASDHPILKGVEPFETPTKLYKNPHMADDTNLLLTGTIPEHTEPVAWTREHRGGRVFYTSLGGPEDFEKKVFRTLLVNAIFWTAQAKTNHVELAASSTTLHSFVVIANDTTDSMLCQTTTQQRLSTRSRADRCCRYYVASAATCAICSRRAEVAARARVLVRASR